MPREVGDNAEGCAHHYGGQDREAVEAVGQVDRVTGADDDKVGQQDKQRPHAPGEVLEERYVTVGW